MPQPCLVFLSGGKTQLGFVPKHSLQGYECWAIDLHHWGNLQLICHNGRFAYFPLLAWDNLPRIHMQVVSRGYTRTIPICCPRNHLCRPRHDCWWWRCCWSMLLARLLNFILLDQTRSSKIHDPQIVISTNRIARFWNLVVGLGPQCKPILMGGALYRLFVHPMQWRGYLIPMHELKVPCNYLILYNDLFVWTLPLLLLSMPMQF